MSLIQLSKPDKIIKGRIRLDGSKSVSNRALIIKGLCDEDISLHHLSTSKDTVTLQHLLGQYPAAEVYDAGAAGTTYRFMTAYLALRPGTQVLTGTDRMKQRPIGVLVDALRTLGADIEYTENEGYPPLKINAPRSISVNRLSIPAGTSSQYISALLMLAPTLPQGLELTLTGNIVSRSYIEITTTVMRHFGVECIWEGNRVKVPPQKYQAKEFTVEADWSAASYHYALAILAEEVDLYLDGLFADSVQGDSAVVGMAEKFGIRTEYTKTGIRLTKSGQSPRPVFEQDFILCPDIAQTLAVICGATGTQGLFTGLQTLSIKETDRIAALQNELAKVNVWLSKLPPRFSKKHPEKVFYMVEGKAEVTNTPCFPTYEDHRMAMSFAPLALLGTIEIEEPRVVDKSYPNFWRDLEELGFVGRGESENASL